MKRMQRVVIIYLFVSFLNLSSPAFIGKINADDDVIQLDSGSIRGTVQDGARFYAGIPYAAPPVGELRWKPPQPVAPWSGIRECVKFGPICPQAPSPGMKEEDIKTASEDCLYLNIWAPLKKSADKKPVMVWIHGGAFVVGSGSSETYNGTNYAKNGVVIVTLNYRLGAFGFLAHPLLSDESPHGISGNYGLLDQIEALKWVKRNIAAFGGDPENITIFGESAGSISVGFHTVIPRSGGLFNRVIMESGAPMANPYILPLATGSMSQALKTGVRFADSLGCSGKIDILAAMRTKTSGEILAITPVPPDFAFARKGMMFAPVYDGWLFPEDPEKIISSGKQRNVPLLIGTNKNEATIFITGLTMVKYREWVNRTFGDFALHIFSMFPIGEKEDLFEVADKVCTLLWFQQPARHLAGSMADLNKSIYLYQFTRVSPKNEEEKQTGAFHSCELPYVFGNIGRKEWHEEYDIFLSETIMSYWINFASKGDPNSLGLPEWPAYNRENNINLEFGNKVAIKIDLDKKASDLIEKFRLGN
ncbi:MAG: carboxylesterase/lipase family protein [Candidatus Omnitrophota bacterium]